MADQDSTPDQQEPVDYKKWFADSLMQKGTDEAVAPRPNDNGQVEVKVRDDSDIGDHAKRYADTFHKYLRDLAPDLTKDQRKQARDAFEQEMRSNIQGRLLQQHTNAADQYYNSGYFGVRRKELSEIGDVLPFGRTLKSLADTKMLSNAADRFSKGQATSDDYQLLGHRIARDNYDAKAGLGEQAYNMGMSLPTEAAEWMMLGGPAGKAGEAGAAMGAKWGLNEAGQAAMRYVGAAAARTAMRPDKIAAETYQAMQPRMEVGDNQVYTQPGEGFGTALRKSATREATSNLAFEASGAMDPKFNFAPLGIAASTAKALAGGEAAKEGSYWLGAGGTGGVATQLVQAKNDDERKAILKRFGMEGAAFGALETLMHGAGTIDHARAERAIREGLIRQRLSDSGVPVGDHDALVADYMKSTSPMAGDEAGHNEPFQVWSSRGDYQAKLKEMAERGQNPNVPTTQDVLDATHMISRASNTEEARRMVSTMPEGPAKDYATHLVEGFQPGQQIGRAAQQLPTGRDRSMWPAEVETNPWINPERATEGPGATVNPAKSQEGWRQFLTATGEKPPEPPSAQPGSSPPPPPQQPPEPPATPSRPSIYHIADYKNPEKSVPKLLEMIGRKGSGLPYNLHVWDGPDAKASHDANIPAKGASLEFDREDYNTIGQVSKGGEGVPLAGSNTSYARSQFPPRYDPSLKTIRYNGRSTDPAFGRLKEAVDKMNAERGDADYMKGFEQYPYAMLPVDLVAMKDAPPEPIKPKLIDRMRAKSAADAAARAQPGQAPRSEKRGVAAEGPTAEGPAEQLARSLATGEPANDQAEREAARQKILDDRLRLQSSKKSDRMRNYHDAVEDALASPDAKKLDRLAQVLVNIGEEADAKDRPIEEVAKQYLPKLAEKLGDEQFNELVAHVKESANDARGLDKAALANGIEPSSVRRSIAEKLSQQAAFAQAADADQGNALLGGGKGKGQGAEASSAGEGGVAAGSPAHAAGGEAGGDELAGLKALRARFTRARDAMQAELQRSFPSGKRPEGAAGRGWDDRVAQIQEAEANIAKVEEQMEAARHAALIASGRPVSPSLVPLRQKAAMGLIRQEPEIGPYYTAPPPATIERAVAVHKSGDEQAWIYMKDALRRNYNHEWTDWFINGLGNQKIAKRAVPTDLRGINRQIEAEARHYYEDLQMQEELMHHEAQKAGTEHSPAEIAEAVRSGLQDGHNATADEAARHVAPPAESGDAANDDAAHDGRGDAADAGLHADEDFNFGANGSDDGRSIGDTGRSGLKSLADFLTDDTGTAFLNYDKIKQVTGIDIPLRVQELYDGLATMARDVKDTFVKLGGKMFPATSRLNEEAGNKMAQLANSQDYVRRQLPRMIDQVVGPGATEDFRRKVGSVLTEMHLRHTKQAYEGYASDSLAHADQIRQSVDDLPNRTDLSPEAKAKTRRLGLKRIKELEEAAEEASEIAGNVTSIIGKPNHPLASEADFAQAQADPDVKQAIERYKTFFVPEMEANFAKYKGIDHPDSIGDFTQIPDLPMNLLAIKGDGSPQTGVPGTMRGNLKNLKEKYNVFATQRKGNAENYESDLAAIMENSLIRSDRLAKRADLDRHLVSEGLASWGKRGQRIDGATEFPFVQPPKGTQTDQRGESSLYVHNDVAKEYRQLLGVDEPFKIPVLTQLSGIPTWASLASTIEAAYHTKNLLTALSRPGVNPVDIFTNAFKVFRGDPVIADRLVELARIGATKPSEELDTGKGKLLPSKFQKVDPTYWLNRFMNVVDAGMRVTLDDAFNRLAEGRWITGATVENTEANRRDFINQALGQYNKLAQAKIVTALRDSGLGPFATAGTGFYMNGLRALHFDPGVSAKTWKGQLALRAEVAARAAGLLATTAAINYLLWGRVDGDDATPLGAMKVGQTEDGRSRYFDLLNLFTGVPRGLRETGLLAAADGLRRGRTAGQIADRAQDDMLTSLLHPGVGPLVQFAYTAATGKNEIGQRVAKEAEPGSSQAWENLKSAIAQANPVYSSLSAANKVKGEPPSMFDRTVELAGPFAPKARLDPAISDYFDALNNAKKAKLEATRRGVNLQGDMARQYRATHLAEKRMLELGEAIRGLRKVNGHLVQGQPPEPDRVQYLRRQQLQLARRALQAFGQY